MKSHFSSITHYIKSTFRLPQIILLLITAFTHHPQVQSVLAQVREDPEVLLAPALEVFAGSGSSEETYLITLIIIATGLFIAVVVANITWLLHKLTWNVMGRIFSIWLLFAGAVSAVTLSQYLINPTRPTIQAEASATPRNVIVRVSQDEVTLLWQTDKPTLGQLKYKTISEDRYKIINSNQGMRASSHTIIIPRNNQDFEYWFVIVSDNHEYGKQSQPLYLRL